MRACVFVQAVAKQPTKPAAPIVTASPRTPVDMLSGSALEAAWTSVRPFYRRNHKLVFECKLVGTAAFNNKLGGSGEVEVLQKANPLCFHVVVRCVDPVVSVSKDFTSEELSKLLLRPRKIATDAKRSSFLPEDDATLAAVDKAIQFWTKSGGYTVAYLPIRRSLEIQTSDCACVRVCVCACVL